MWIYRFTFFILATAIFAQAQEFEAASVKLSSGPEDGITIHATTGGPGTSSPALFRCMNCTPGQLIQRAFDVEAHQISGPSWLDVELQVSAKVPIGATKEQFRAMVQKLLADRFKLTLHRETRDLQGYRISVLNTGPKLQPALPAPEAPLPRSSLNASGFVVLPPGQPAGRIQTYRNNDKISTLAGNATLPQLAIELARALHQPVEDGTGLSGQFQFALYWMRLPDLEGPSLSAGLRALGLRLERRVIPAEILVIDHLEKAPTAN